MQRIFLVITGSMVILIGAAAVFLVTQQPDRPTTQAAVNVEGADIGGAFALVDHTGQLRTNAEVIDGPTFIYFGYTYCPDVCPLDTQIMVDVVDHLAERQIDATPVFITVDPERDDVATMAAWAEIHHPKMLAMTGDAEQIAIAAKAYKAYYQRVETEGASGYLMNHSAFLYLMDESGVRALYRSGFPAEEIAEDAAWVLSN